MFDPSNLPVSSGLLIGSALYILASIGAGQVVGARAIAQSGWIEDCETSISQFFENEITTRQEEEALVPETDCDSVLGRWHPVLGELCGELGNPDLAELGGYDVQVARKAEERARDAERRQLESAAAGAGSQCSCAAAVYARQTLIGLAVYAGTARLVTLPNVENMEASLQAALSEPLCTAYTGGL